MAYEPTESSIIVADRTGEVYSFPWPLSPPQVERYKHITTISDPGNPVSKASDERFMGTLLLGHSSSVVALTTARAPWGKVLATVDRDEHIRISVFPQTWVIHAMGLGHTAFVSCVLSVDDVGIITGGGDNQVISWDFEGALKAKYSISSGTCVRLLRRWNDLVITAGERFVPLTVFVKLT